MLRRYSRGMSDDKRSQNLAPIHEQPRWLDHDNVVLSPISFEDTKTSDTPSRTAIALALLFTILGFTIQIEAIAYYQEVLGWRKPFLSLYLADSALALPWIFHLIYLRAQQQRVPLRTWVRRYVDDILDSVTTIDAYADGLKLNFLQYVNKTPTPSGFLLGSTAIVTAVLTVSGVSWFVALAYTTPGDLTAIYNCSAFFAAVFSVPLLGQNIGRTTIIAVALSIIGTMIIAYGDSGPTKSETAEPIRQIGMYRLTGNIIAAVGAVTFGLYCVIFKRWTSIQNARHASSSFDLAVAASGLTGAYTFALGWIGIILLHAFRVEVFVMPSMQVLLYLVISIISGAGEQSDSHNLIETNAA